MSNNGVVTEKILRGNKVYIKKTWFGNLLDDVIVSDCALKSRNTLGNCHKSFNREKNSLK